MSTPLIGTADALTPEWLASVLTTHDGRSPSITAVDLQAIGQGQLGATYAVTPTYGSGGEGFPARVVVKLPAADPNSRAFAQNLGCYAREVAFYTEAASRLAVRTPQCWAATVSEDGADFVLVLEDLSPARECGQLDGCGVEEARAALAQAAALHASSWGDAELARAEWLLTGTGVWRHLSAKAPATAEAFAERFAGRMDDATERAVAGLANGPAAVWVERGMRPRCVWHSDFRLDNLLFDAAGGAVPLVVVDWQSVTWADGTIDASYFLGAGMPTELRREHQESLIRGYHEALVAGGVRDYSWDECWDDYRAHAIAGLLVAITAGMGTTPSPEADALFLTMASRHAQHMLDVDTLSLLAAG
ncbi:hypothetical protein GCM10009547_17420 [Sporichthya brevicatena]|uniref:Aminoglycoside phosphotransferase domain-containing protein n=1 Tax=Sporichthya brevicatena TaxID=171442 RepID=A0ABN1GPS4_9ACTN